MNNQMNKKLTPWFDGNIPPVHVGFYERQYSFNPSYQEQFTNDFWNGENWFLVDSRGEVLNFPHKLNELKWRGLAEKPE